MQKINGVSHQYTGFALKLLQKHIQENLLFNIGIKSGYWVIH